MRQYPRLKHPVSVLSTSLQRKGRTGLGLLAHINKGVHTDSKRKNIETLRFALDSTLHIHYFAFGNVLIGWHV